jgi:hypothetical protein
LRLTAFIHLCDAPYDFGTGTIHSFAAHLESDLQFSFDDNELIEVRWFNLADALTLAVLPAMAYTLRCRSKAGYTPASPAPLVRDD